MTTIEAKRQISKYLMKVANLKIEYFLTEHYKNAVQKALQGQQKMGV